MYKVFIDNSFLKFKKSENFSTNIDDQYLPQLKTSQLNAFMSHLKMEQKYVSSPDPMEKLKSYFSNFKWIEAAGGVVQYKSSQNFLFIYRNGVWDLPKGKIENNEIPFDAALREVKEECGLVHLEIFEELSPTFHVYFAYDDFWIKKTHWFKMISPDKNLVPQVEEGITNVEWCNSDEIEKIMNTTFASLIPVIEAGTDPKS
jgi:8-oxo-dGTP pyrophosphatase MutT (NUDIX family)